MAREDVLNEFGQIFVEDRPVHRDAINILANVQSKAVFSFAVAVIDKICGWAQAISSKKMWSVVSLPLDGLTRWESVEREKGRNSRNNGMGWRGTVLSMTYKGSMTQLSLDVFCVGFCRIMRRRPEHDVKLLPVLLHCL